MVTKILLYASIASRRKTSTVDIRVDEARNAWACDGAGRHNPARDSSRNVDGSDDIRSTVGVINGATVERQPTLGINSSTNFNTVVTRMAKVWPNELLPVSLAELSNILIQVAIGDHVILVCF